MVELEGFSIDFNWNRGFRFEYGIGSGDDIRELVVIGGEGDGRNFIEIYFKVDYCLWEYEDVIFFEDLEE